MGDANQDIDQREIEQRVMHALGLPLVRLADALRVPLGDALNALRLSYFQHLKAKGFTLARVGELLDVSERQAKRLQQQLREQFLSQERVHELPTRIEFVLWATPMSRVKLKQVLRGVDGDDIDAALDGLLADERIAREAGRTEVFRANRMVHSLVRDSWIARIGGLTSLLANVTDAVYGRFFKNEPRALARTMSFLVREQDVPELERLLREHIVPTLTELDERAKASGDGEPFRFSVCWAPYDYLDKTLEEGKDK